MRLDCPYVEFSKVSFYKLSLDGQSRYFSVDNRTVQCNATLHREITFTQSNYDLIKLLVLFAFFINLNYYTIR